MGLKKFFEENGAIELTIPVAEIHRDLPEQEIDEIIMAIVNYKLSLEIANDVISKKDEKEKNLDDQIKIWKKKYRLEKIQKFVIPAAMIVGVILINSLKK